MLNRNNCTLFFLERLPKLSNINKSSMFHETLKFLHIWNFPLCFIKTSSNIYFLIHFAMFQKKKSQCFMIFRIFLSFAIHILWRLYMQYCKLRDVISNSDEESIVKDSWTEWLSRDGQSGWNKAICGEACSSG